MAKYQRDFLVPYLRNIAALELALHKLQKQLTVLEDRRETAENAFCGGIPMQPVYEAANGVFFLGLGAFTFLFSAPLFFVEFYFLGLCLAMSGVMEIIIGVVRYHKVTRENTEKEKRYNLKLAEYQEARKKHIQERQFLPQILSGIQQCNAEIQRVQETLDQVYAANVIAPYARGLYTSVFLYIWFATGKPNDLQLALESFHIQTVKTKLDQILSAENDTLLDQYLRFVSQPRLQELQEETVAMLENKLEQIDASAAENRTYLAMIQSNATTIAYFVAAPDLVRR